MTWTVPDVDRVDEPFAGDERAMLQGFLNFGRKTLLLKCAGLTGDALAQRPIEPSTLSLLGLVRHVTEVERTWFRQRFGGEDVTGPYRRDGQPDAAFHDVDPKRAERDIADLCAEWHAADRAVSCLPLDHSFVSERWGEMTLRWAYSHMIGEYNRHNGHADLLRQRIDGVIGT